MAARGVERDAGEHRRVHHLGARLGVGRIVHRAHEELPTIRNASVASMSDNGFAPCYIGRVDAVRRIEPSRIRARSERFERVAHAVEAGRGDGVAGKVRVTVGIDQRDVGNQPARDDAGLGVERAQSRRSRCPSFPTRCRDVVGQAMCGLTGPGIC